MKENIKLSPWVLQPNSKNNEVGHCCFRYILGTDPNKIENRVAFIEKTARIRIQKADPSNINKDYKNWLAGYSGSGGVDGHIPSNKIYGYNPKARMWCDTMLILLGYQIPQDNKLTLKPSELNKVLESDLIFTNFELINTTISKLLNTFDFKDELKKLQEENKKLRGSIPEPPPRPPYGDGLPRYGIKWNGDKEPLTTPMDDGYWTPYHLAIKQIQKLRGENE